MAGASASGGKPEVGPTPPEGGPRRLLVVAAEEIVGDDLVREIERHAGGDRAEALIVAPSITGSRLQHAMGDVDDAIQDAQIRLDHSLKAFRGSRISVEQGVIGDSDPVIAIEDGLARFPAHEIVIVTRPEDEARWLEGDLFDRARQKFEPEIVHLSVTGEGPGQQEVAEVESAGSGAEPPPETEVGRSWNMPPLSLRDIAGIVVAIVGTIVLVVLAAQCGGEEVQREAGTSGVGTEGNCVARYIIAGGAALVNIAHVVGLVLFEAVRYRGFWERGFAMLSLYGTPVAVVVSLLLD